MANINDILKTKHLKPYDLQGKEPVVTVARARQLKLGKAQELKWVLDFVGKAKYLILNTTMLRAMERIAGDGETDHWGGVVVQLYTTTDRDVSTGQQVPVVRVKQPTRLPQLVQRGGTR